MTIILETSDYYKTRRTQQAQREGCRVCVYGEEIEGENLWRCRHLSPMNRRQKGELDAAWLHVLPEDWCGDWLPRESDVGGGL